MARIAIISKTATSKGLMACVIINAAFSSKKIQTKDNIVFNYGDQ
jgi:hypothetical protein